MNDFFSLSALAIAFAAAVAFVFGCADLAHRGNGAPDKAK